MKIKSLSLFLILSALLSLSAFSARADVTFQVFYDSLGGSGQWANIDGYGYGWQPGLDDPNWSPYVEGHWVYTDYGWTWVSDEPWGWATYHYGRWINFADRGWFWIPGYRWAPAWVSWRYGGGYCGWAPLPPVRGGVQGEVNFGADVDVNFHIGAGAYNFVPVRSMGDPSMRSSIVNRINNYTVINNTRNVTNIRIEGADTIPIVGGPSLTAVNARAAHPFQQLQLQRSEAASGEAHGAEIHGNSLQVYAPTIARTSPNARPNGLGDPITQASINRGDDPSHPLRATRRANVPEVAPEKIEAARQAQAHVSAQTSSPRPEGTTPAPVAHETEARPAPESHAPIESERPTPEQRAPTENRPAPSRTEEAPQTNAGEHPAARTESRPESHPAPEKPVAREAAPPQKFNSF